MRIDLWTIGLQAINVVILIVLLSKLFFRPIAKAIEDRQAAARSLLEDAARAKAEAEAAREEAIAERTRLEAERAQKLRDTVASAEETRAALLAEARREAERIREAAHAEMAHARADEQRALQLEAGRLALDIAGRVLERLPPSAKVEGLLGRLAEGLHALPPAAHDAASAEEPVVLAAAAPLEPPVAQACRALLERAFGRPVEIIVEADPNLIAGYELRLPNAVVRDNVRADLEHIAAALAAPKERAP